MTSESQKGGGRGSDYLQWRVKQGKKTVFSGTKGDCVEFIRKHKGKLIAPNTKG